MTAYVITYNIYTDGKITGGGYVARDDLISVLKAFSEVIDDSPEESCIADIVIKEFQ